MLERYNSSDVKSLEDAFARNPTTPDSKRWMCPNCGVIEPKLISFGGKSRYIRLSCPCEQAEKKRQQKEEQEKAWLVHISSACYSWLGPDWTDASLKQKTFENFDTSRQPEAVAMAHMFLERPYGSLVFYGSFGTGKTHLLTSVCNVMLQEKRCACLFTTAPKLFAAIQQRITDDTSYSYLVTSAIKTPLLVIDDIDKAKHTEFREEIYFEIVDERVKAGLPIAISTNRLDRIADFVGGAVCSRLKVGQIPVEMTGSDYREEL